MPRDRFYGTQKWYRICDQVRARSGGMCEVPGCTVAGKVFDHIKPRRQGGADHPGNVRHLCRTHDNQIKEDAAGKRRSGGRLTVDGCDAAGMPLDPAHWWVT